ncbi:PREDICTED: probable C-terminal domain small phosphatase [Camelina sativa]|uniref:Probable C-terminal domain small phosphatase n=1 Tax=Camelina sativa TaxID=90675 RepID=A0ABM0YDX3_CAMSA|nr:PREDICTED: probable C-terminal domain small phosphatase [Camelina sativa]
MSILKFHCRLLRCFTRCFKVTTVSYPATKHGYTILDEEPQDPLTEHTNMKRTIILDLDETLVHSTTQIPGVKYDFMVMVKMEMEIMPIFVVKRPGVTEFLDRLGENYTVAVFTAGLEDYASQVLDKIDKNHVISQRLYRDSCTEVNGKYAKDLSLVVGEDLRSALIVDDNPSSYSLQPENGVPIKAFVGDLKDQELLKLVEFLECCDSYEDMRDAVKDLLAN